MRGGWEVQSIERVLWPILIVIIASSGALFIRPPVILGSGNWIGHAIGYAIMAWVLGLRRVYPMWVIAVGLTLLGGLLEVLQPYFGRTASLADAAANGSGALAGLMIAALVNWVWTRHFAPSSDPN